jgi:hypothetical protein
MKRVGLAGALFSICLVGCDRAADAGIPQNPAPPVAGAGAGAAGRLAPSGESGSPAVPAHAGSSSNAGTGALAGSGGAHAGSGGAASDPNAMPDAAMPEAGAGAEDDWETIISADWMLPAGQERYFCQRQTLAEDVYVSAVKAINPLGTHHTALTAAATAGQPDGLRECSSGGLEPQGIFGSGVGTEPVIYPPGVGLLLRAGQQLLLNLHVFNVTQQRLSGTSGTAIRRADAASVQHVAESLLAGPVRFSIPTGGESTVHGTCTMTHDVTLFAVQPHMHQIGVHMRGVARSSTQGEVVLHDGAFEFENQLVYSIDPVEMKQGDVVEVECTFDNRGTAPIPFGESSTQEMCFLVLHRYPAAEQPSVNCFR